MAPDLVAVDAPVAREDWWWAGLVVLAPLASTLLPILFRPGAMVASRA